MIRPTGLSVGMILGGFATAAGVGLVAVGALAVPTDDVTVLLMVDTFGESGLTTVTVTCFSTLAPEFTVTDCVHDVPAAAGAVQLQP